jgi:hypothetical protein
MQIIEMHKSHGYRKPLVAEQGFFQYWNDKFAEKQKKYAEDDKKFRDEMKKKNKAELDKIGAGVKKQQTQADRIKNIANVKKDVDSQGIIRNPSSTWNGMRWVEYVTNYKITQDEVNHAESMVVKMKKDGETQSKRIADIANIAKSTDSNNIIRDPNSKYNGTSWSDYIKTNNVKIDELKKALEKVPVK